MKRKRGRPATARALKNKIIELHSRGASVSVIIDRLGISRASIYRHLELDKRDLYLRKLIAEANRRIKRKKKQSGSAAAFYRGREELKEDLNPKYATEEKRLDEAMSLIGEDTTLWNEFKQNLALQLAEKEMDRFLKEMSSDDHSDGQPETLSEDDIAEIRKQIPKRRVWKHPVDLSKAKW